MFLRGWFLYLLIGAGLFKSDNDEKEKLETSVLRL